jgi:hypothetical protein
MTKLRTKKFIYTMMLLLGTITSLPSPSRAAPFSFGDRDRAQGRLAIERIRVRIDEGIVMTVFLKQAIDPSELTRDEFFVVELQTNHRPRPEETIFFFARKGRWDHAIYYWRTKTFTYFTGNRIRQLSPRSIRLRFSSTSEPSAGGYLYRLASVSSGEGCGDKCWDAVPNRGWFVLDWTSPAIRRFDVTPLAQTAPEGGLQIPVTWRVTDRGLSGLKSHTLWMRTFGETEWKKVLTSRSEEALTHLLPVDEGQHLQFQITAKDNFGNNVTSEIRESFVPFDDTSPEGTTYFGYWSEEDRPDSYGGSIHKSTTPLDTFSFSGEGTQFCLYYLTSPEFGTAEVEYNGERHGTIRMDSGDRFWCYPFADSAHRTITVTVASGVINIDGFWFE